MKISKDIIAWLLAGDPAIRWQTMRDLLKADEREVERERAKIQRAGWGAAVLSHQDEDGRWAGQLYNKKWISTTYALLLLKEFGLAGNEKTARGCEQLMRNGSYRHEEIRFSKNQQRRDNGVTGLALGILCHFAYPDDRLHAIADYLVRSQHEDGSWLYDDTAAATGYRFETTMIVLKGILEYQKRFPSHRARIFQAQSHGREFLLRQSLFLDPITNAPLNKKWLLFSFPYYWFYDILVALDYFRESDAKDERLHKALAVMRGKRNGDGTWNVQNRHAGETFFEMEQAGKPSRWNTLRCLRVLSWWESS